MDLASKDLPDARRGSMKTFVARVGTSRDYVARGPEAKVRAKSERYTPIFTLTVEPDDGTGRLIHWYARWRMRRLVDKHEMRHSSASIFALLGMTAAITVVVHFQTSTLISILIMFAGWFLGISLSAVLDDALFHKQDSKE